MSVLLEQFDTIFDTPESVKELEELILDIAVRGKLVPQDPNDEPASVLLEKIKEEKERLTEEKKIKKEKPLPSITEEEKPYELPQGWEWVRLGNISKIIEYGTSQKASEQNVGVPVLRMNNILDGKIVLNNLKYVQQDIKDLPRLYLNRGDLLFNRTNSYELVGKTAVFKERLPFTFASYLIRISLFNEYIDWSYVNIVMNSGFYRSKQIEPGITQQNGQANFNGTKLKNTLIPIPPLVEQRRIVEKLDQLMIFCEKLKEQLEKKQRREDKLNISAFSSLEQSATEKELQINLQFVLSNLRTLCTDIKHVQQLRNAILSLAVKGQLVQQDENDEPAIVFLEKIKQEKDRLIKETKIKREKQLPQIVDDERPFELPYGWEWTRIGDITTIKGGKRLPAGYQLTETPTQHIYIRVSDMKNNTIVDNDLRYITDEIYQKIGNYIIKKEDLYITIVGSTIGKVGMIPDKFDSANLTENAARIILHIVNKEFLLYVLNSKFIQEQFVNKTKQVGQPKLALSRLKSTLIPLPPLNEQKRIVEKLNQLMTLCDELERNIEESKLENEKLLKAVLQEAFAVKEEALN